MKIKIYTFLLILILNSTAFASKENNIKIVKDMFTEFAEGLDVSKIDRFYTKDFILESNNEIYDYHAYKKLETEINRQLKSLKVTWQDIFSDHDKVSGRLRINLIYRNGESKTFYVLLIARIKDNKIDRLWELTYPGWK